MFTGPNKTRDGLILTMDARNFKSYRRDYNIMSDADWVVGGSTSLGDMYSYSNQNRIIMATNPWGDEVEVWEAYSVQDSLNGGGIYGRTVNVDNTKMYRMSWWEKRVTNSTATEGRWYAGLNAYGSVDGVLSRVSGGSPDTNPYFWYSQLPTTNSLPEGQWCLVVAHVWSDGSGVGSNHEDSGIYSLTDRIGNIITDYVMIPETTTMRSRTLSLYRPNADGVIHHSVYPRFDLCDGTEPTIDELLNAKTKRWKDLYSKGQFDIIGAKWNPNGYLSFRGQGTTDGVIKGDRIRGFGGLADTRLYPDGMTISWWQRMGENPPPRQSVLMGSSTIMHVEFWGADTENPSFRTEAAINNNYSFGTGTIPGGSLVGRWVKFDLVFDFTTSPRSVRWYHNGELFHTHANFDSGTSGVDEYFKFIEFGRATGSTQYLYSTSFKGDLAKIDIYNRPLTSNEVKNNYNGFKGRFSL
jgi:hypothetical protein